MDFYRINEDYDCNIRNYEKKSFDTDQTAINETELWTNSFGGRL